MGTLDKLSIGKRIQQQRELMGYTREELAEMADITPRFCYDLELGQKACPWTPCASSNLLCI